MKGQTVSVSVVRPETVVLGWLIAELNQQIKDLFETGSEQDQLDLREIIEPKVAQEVTDGIREIWGEPTSDL